eukprot:c6357_g1_i1.p3 GENE.c6357_g1_i1~~c6357_g1_i1.p3  ORF type:complete len:112 (-),score=17.44 c6357_g1_i1:505-840(-)
MALSTFAVFALLFVQAAAVVDDDRAEVCFSRMLCVQNTTRSCHEDRERWLSIMTLSSFGLAFYLPAHPSPNLEVGCSLNLLLWNVVSRAVRGVVELAATPSTQRGTLGRFR